MILQGNPLLTKPVLEIADFGLSRAFESGKVRESFWLPDGNLLLIDTDRIGAFDQPHRMTDGRPAFYPGKGILINAFNQEGERIVSELMPTDYVPLAEKYKKLIPKELWSRCAVHLPVKKRILVEAIGRSGCEGSMAKTAKAGKPLCGQDISPDLYKGQLLDRPMFTPTSKAPKGEKDKPYTLNEYYREVGDKDIANYIYGITILLHLRWCDLASDNNLDHPDDKFEFGLFETGTPIIRKSEKTKTPWEKLFRRLCQYAALESNSWLRMPGFDFDLFSKFAEYNNNTGVVRLIDERGSTDSSRWRPAISTHIGRQLHEKGQLELARTSLDDFYCKEWFRAKSKETGQGGYDEDSKRIVTLADWVLTETGKRNLMAYLHLYGE